MTPAQRIIARFGGVTALARALGQRNPTTVQGWKQRGLIPARRQQQVLDAAQALGISLTPRDFFDPATAGTPAPREPHNESPVKRGGGRGGTGATVSRLIEEVEALSRTRVLCIGDLMLDRFIYGGVERVSPEAPIPVVRVEKETTMPGGAGNVVRNLVALGARVVFLSVVGDDGAADELRRLLPAGNALDPVVFEQKGRPTTIKTRYVAAGQQLLRADREAEAPIDPALGEKLLRRAEAALRSCDVVVLSDYAKGVLDRPRVARLIELARSLDKPVVVDPKGVDFKVYRGASVVTPNRFELSRAVNLPTGTNEEAALAARRLRDSCGTEAVLVTRGKDGMTLLPPEGGAALHLPTLGREVFDVSGAGDTVAATLAAGLGARLSLVDAAGLANVAAGIVVSKLGTAVAYADDLIGALHHRELASGEAKVLALAPALDRVARWRAQGLNVGFTNGCFDLLHPGHVSLLAQGRAACDRLVVGLNSDASVARLKGAGRPVQTETARAAVLASLAHVDLVVVFAEDTPMRLIEALRPEILVKGADYTIDQVVGADLVRGYGGRVVLAELAPGHSTTATVARIAG
jgi:D-beta-D-heptose 7-phosphate kinase/D-beta-D-heptose 1-phosphate adenosyltransferase